MSQVNETLPVQPVAYSVETLNALADCGEKFARTDTDRAFALHQFMRAVGDAPTYDQWMSARAQAIVGYKRTKPAANDDACNTWWSRMLGALKTYANEGGFNFTIPNKPKSDNPDAVKQQEKRANPYADKTRNELQAVVQELTLTDTLESAKLKVKALDALDKLNKAEAKATEKASADALKPRREAINKAIKSAPGHVLALIEAVIDLTADNASDEAKARAWHVLNATAPKAPKATDKVRKAA